MGYLLPHSEIHHKASMHTRSLVDRWVLLVWLYTCISIYNVLLWYIFQCDQRAHRRLGQGGQGMLRAAWKIEQKKISHTCIYRCNTIACPLEGGNQTWFSTLALYPRYATWCMYTYLLDRLVELRSLKWFPWKVGGHLTGTDQPACKKGHQITAKKEADIHIHVFATGCSLYIVDSSWWYLETCVVVFNSRSGRKKYNVGRNNKPSPPSV